MPVLSFRSSICIAAMAAGLMLSGAVTASHAGSVPGGQGESVSTSDLTASSKTNTFMIVGAPYTSNSSGAAIIFKRDSKGAWAQLTKFNPTSQMFAQYGRSVSMSLDGTVAVVGAPGNNASNVINGKGGFFFYIYANGAWKQRVEGVGFAVGDAMGQSVYVTPDGSKFFVGAPGVSNGKGAVYAFKVRKEINNFEYLGSFVPADEGYANFGTSISASKNGDYVVVGGDLSSSGKGAAWVFRPTGSEGRYTVGTKIVGTGGVGTTQGQGRSVAMNWDGDTIALGAPGEGGDKGAVYVFARNNSGGWDQKARLKDAAAPDHAGLGTSVAMSGNGGGTIVAGEPYAQTGAGDTDGRVVTFVKAAKSWTYTAKPGLSNSSCNGLGSSLVIADDASLLAAGAPSSVNSAKVYTGAVCYFAKAKVNTKAWDIKGNPVIAK